MMERFGVETFVFILLLVLLLLVEQYATLDGDDDSLFSHVRLSRSEGEDPLVDVHNLYSEPSSGFRRRTILDSRPRF